MNDEINNILIIGSGNISWHLEKNFKKKNIIVSVIGARKFLESNSDKYKQEFKNKDLIIIAVIDSEISNISRIIYDEKLLGENKILVHTSGSMGIEIIKNKGENYGVFYPLQTFTKNKEIDFTKVPICIEANNLKTLNELNKIGKLLSDNIYEIDSSQRKQIHISAVFACNFVNHLIGISKQELNKKNIPFEILFPLIDETISKAKESNPFKSQTGPAIRGDIKTMESHIQDLENDERDIYKLLSQKIINKNKEL